MKSPAVRKASTIVAISNRLAYQKMRIRQGRAGATVNRDLNYCNAAYNRALRKKLVKENPFTGFDKFREEPRTPYLSEAALLNCRDIRTVQELLGHKDMRMTQRYTHVLDRQKRDVASQLGSFVNGIVEDNFNKL